MNRIVFNGQEYSSRDAMPEDVRRAYDEALATLRDAYPDAVPGAAGVSRDHTVVNVQRKVSFSFNPSDGEALPASVRRLMEPAQGRGPDQTEERGGSEVFHALETSWGMLLAFGAGFVLVFAIALMFTLGGGRSHLLGRLAIAAAALFLLGGLDGMATRLARRRESLLGPDSPGYRRFVVWSSAGFATAAVLLLGLALYMP
jgi:hypothetical protein